MIPDASCKMNKRVKNILQRLGIAAGAEAGENVLQDITQSFLDEFVNGERSELKRAYASKLAEGMSESEAFKDVAKEYAQQLLMSGATGAVMGAGMMGGQTGLNAIRGGVLNDVLNQNSKRFNEKFEEWKGNRVPKVDPAELAEQNEIDVNEKVDNVNQAVDEINNLAEQIPDNTQLTDEEAEALQRGIERSAEEEAMNAGEIITPPGVNATDEVAEALENTGIPEETEPSEITSNNVNPPENIPPEGGQPSNSPTSRKGLRRSYTNTGVKSGIVDPYDLENNPVTMKDAEYEKHSNVEVSNEARKTLDERRDMFAEEYSSGTREVKEDIDLDRAMMLAEDDRTSSWMKDSILRNIGEHGTKAGQFIQAFAKWANTATGALAKATQVTVDNVKKWETRNKKRVETNNRIAQAINLIGVPEGSTQRVPLSHDQLKEQIAKTIQDAFGEDASKFSDEDIEYLTILAETKKVPVRTITRELEHKLETGEWFTIDESLPAKVEKAIKNGTISNMLDRIVNGETPKPEKEPEAYGRFLKKIRNSLQDENIGLSDIFDDLDVYFLGKLIQESVPKAEIENELRHRIETGEWYTIDESIQAPKHTDQKLQNAFKMLRGEDVKTEAEPKTFEQIRDEVKNTLEKNEVLDNFSDEDIDYLANLRQQGATTKYLADVLNTKEATGSWGIKPETQQRVNEIYEMIRHYDENSEEFVEGQAEAFRL